MSAQQSDLPGELLSSQHDASMQRQVVRRATQLCRRAEPHTDETPCAAHMNEANRQLLELRG
jgi:hypothetical protein